MVTRAWHLLTVATFAISIASVSNTAGAHGPFPIQEAETEIVVGTECDSREEQRAEFMQCGDAYNIASLECFESCQDRGCGEGILEDASQTTACTQFDISAGPVGLPAAGASCRIDATCTCMVCGESRPRKR